MELQELIRIILKYKKFILLLALSATVQAVLLTYALSEKFRASALVLIRPRQNIITSATTTSKELLDFPIPMTVPFEAMLQTYAEVLKSPAIAGKVVRSLRLDVEEPPKTWWKKVKNDVVELLYDTWTLMKYGKIEPTDPFRKAVELITENLTVTPTKDTYIFEIKYESSDPNAAAAVVNTAAEMLVEYYGEVSRSESKQMREFVQSRLNESQSQLQKSNRSLQQFKERNDITLIDSQLKSRIDALAEFEKSLETTRHEIQEARAEIAEIQKQIGGQDAYLKSTITTADNPLVTSLNSDLAKYEIDLSGKLKKLGPSHPEIIALEAEIGETKKKLTQETQRRVIEETSSLNSVHQNLLNDLVRVETRLQGLLAKETNLNPIISKLKNELKDVPRQQSQLSRLELDVSVTEEKHKLITKQYEDALIREADIRETRLVSPADPPVYPFRPIKVYYAGLAFVIAIVAGIGWALASQWIETSQRRSSDYVQPAV